MSEEDYSCNFCGKDRSLVKKLISGPGVYICNECIDLSYRIINQTIREDITEFKNQEIPTATEIKAELDKFVVGQEHTKQILSVSAVNHMKRLMLNDTDKGIDIQKSNVLMLGSTGTGKTLLAKTLAQILELPIAITDATSLTEAGYMGEDAESIVERLLVAANNDLDEAQHGIIFVDEIDKKAAKNSGTHAIKDVSGEGVQQSLLKLVEGTVVKVKTESKGGYEATVDFDTSNVLFIFSGAFVGLEKIIERRLNSSSGMGFSAQLSNTKLHESNHILKSSTVKDLRDYGIIPELLGRLPVLAILDTLTVEDYVKILSNISNSITEQYQMLAEMDDVNISFSAEFLNDVAEKCRNSNLGGRALRSLMDNATLNLFYRISELKKSGVVHIEFTKYLEAPTLHYGTGADSKTDTDYIIYRGDNVK